MSAATLRDDAIAPDDWLTRALGMPAFALRPPLPAAAGLAAVIARLPDPAFCFAKVPGDDTAAVQLLEAAGFRVVDSQRTFERAAEPAAGAPRVPVRRAEPHDREAVLEIAVSCFRYSRFHQDARIGVRAANELKRAWMANCLDGKRGEEVLVALDEDRPAGFLAVLLAKDAAVIDLVGVAEHNQRRGVGGALVDAFIARWRSRAACLRVGTQAVNKPSIRLYEGRGFRFIGAASVLHAHFRGGRPT